MLILYAFVIIKDSEFQPFDLNTNAYSTEGKTELWHARYQNIIDRCFEWGQVSKRKLFLDSSWNLAQIAQQTFLHSSNHLQNGLHWKPLPVVNASLLMCVLQNCFPSRLSQIKPLKREIVPDDTKYEHVSLVRALSVCGRHWGTQQEVSIAQGSVAMWLSCSFSLRIISVHSHCCAKLMLYLEKQACWC